MAKTKTKQARFFSWLNGEYTGCDETFELAEDKEILPKKEKELPSPSSKVLSFREKLDGFYKKSSAALSVLLCIAIIVPLIITVSYLPRFGDEHNMDDDVVSQRYIESGLEETGAVNTVAGMILDYRAFDTFGESCVLFTACICVFILLRIDSDKSGKLDPKDEAEMNDRVFEPKNDLILQKVALVLSPFAILLGIYVVLNGHISPGGGFSGGAIIGAGLILYLLAFGFENTRRFINEKVCKVISCCALVFYCLVKSYSFFTGANGLESGIPLGIPGAIISSGLILPLNICVGLVVACTLYSFYSVFRKGGL